MNALWTTRIAAYRYSPLCLESAKEIIDIKIRRKNLLLDKYGKPPSIITVQEVETIQALLLAEARAAKSFWVHFRALLSPRHNFVRRMPGGEDVVNRLLDVGYHHLTGAVRKILEERGVHADLAIFHVARGAKSAPLAYDLVEMFRADIVDAEVLRFLRLKKKVPTELSQSEIAHFIHEINERLERKYFLAVFKRCHTYRYYMEVQILRFINAINHGKVFESVHLPSRHENRCS